MQITIRCGEEIKTFDLEKLDDLQIKNLELFLENQKDELFEELLQGGRGRLHADGYLIDSPGSSYERYHEINDALAQIEVFKSGIGKLL